MKNFLILLAVILVGLGVYWKFRDQIHGKIDEAQKAEPVGSGSPSIGDKAKRLLPVPSSTPAPAEKLPLVDADFIRRLPDSLASFNAASGAKPDIAIELTAPDEAGGAPPAQIQLAPKVWLDTSVVQWPAGTREGVISLVHLQSVRQADSNIGTPQFMVQCSAEPAPQPLESGIRAQRWRTAVLTPGTALTYSGSSPHLWVTEFLKKAEKHELKGPVWVEGTFGTYQRAAGNAPNESVTLEEAKNARFFIPRGHPYVLEAEQHKKKGERVTLKLNINVDRAPKFSAEELDWCIPIKAQIDYWNTVIGGKNRFVHSLTLAAWAETRGLDDAAQASFGKARGEVTRDDASQLGRPARGIRVHLADELDDHWFYDKISPISDPNHHPKWDGQPVRCGLDFFSFARPFCAVLKTNQQGVSTGDCYMVER